jgi:hypothetical protein
MTSNFKGIALDCWIQELGRRHDTSRNIQPEKLGYKPSSLISIGTSAV